MSSIKYSTISQAVVTLAATAGRLAFIIYLIELLAARKLHRLILWILVPCQVIINVISVFLLFFQCATHVDELFNPSKSSHCMSLDVQIDYAYFQGCRYPFSPRRTTTYYRSIQLRLRFIPRRLPHLHFLALQLERQS